MADELQARINLALSILSHKTECETCDQAVKTAMAALEGVPYDVLVREAG